MQILIAPQVRKLIVEHKGEELEWEYSVWGSMQNHKTEDVFAPTNEYLASLPEPQQDKMFEAYKKAWRVKEEPNSRETVKAVYFEAAREMTEDLNEQHLMMWAKENSGVYVEKTPEVRSDKNPKEMTYSEQESWELSVYCIAVKVLAPITGSYVDFIKQGSGGNRPRPANEHKERQSAKLVTQTKLSEFSAFDRLSRYLNKLAARKEKQISMALRFGTPTADLESYLMGMTIVRRLMTATLRSKANGGIVAFMYTFLIEKLSDLANSPEYREKFLSSSDSDDSESDAYSDNFRIPENVDASTVLELNTYLKDRNYHQRHLWLDGQEMIEADKVFQRLNIDMGFKVIDRLHYPIVTLLYRKLFTPQLIQNIDLEALLVCIAHASVFLRKCGWSDIADLITANYKDADHRHMSMTAKPNTSLKQMPAALKERLSLEYPNISKQDESDQTNPGKRWIDSVITHIVLRHEWEGLEDPTRLRISLAEFIIARPMKNLDV